ncbi:MAG: hypothetical protein HY801_13305 [Candidatus Lindowbacteria bacterium]|nr:hypothetical protein [Candidatus Lindowbacteria bacterium]
MTPRFEDMSNGSKLLIEPLDRQHLEKLSALYFRRCKFLKFGNTRIVNEYLSRNIESKNHLYGFVIKKDGRIVGSSYTVRVGSNIGLNLFTVSEEAFTGPRRLGAFGQAYREDLKTLVAHGVNKVLSSVGKENVSYINHSLAGGYIRYAESDTSVFIEMYLPLIASILSTLSGVSLDEIGLLKLAAIAGRPKRVDDSSYTFDFEFEGRNYVLVLDKLSNEAESICCPEFSLGFKYPGPTGSTDKRFALSFDFTNKLNCAQHFNLVAKIESQDLLTTVLEEKRLVGPGSSLHYPLTLSFPDEGTKTLRARVTIDARTLTLAKTLVIHKPLSANTDIARMPTERKAHSSASLRGERSNLIKPPNCQTYFPGSTSDREITFANKRVTARLDTSTGILSFAHALGTCVIFQLPEEIGPPFTEYEFNKFQMMPISYRIGNLPDMFPYRLEDSALKPHVVRKDDGLCVKYAPGCKGIWLEKAISFTEEDEIDIRPKIINKSSKEIAGKIALRTCIRITRSSVVWAPIYKSSLPAKSRQAENPYYIQQLLLSGKKLEENWTAFEFPESNKCVGLCWHGNPEYDFFPLWFNKAPWLIYDLRVGVGQELALPPHLIVFKDGS